MRDRPGPRDRPSDLSSPKLAGLLDAPLGAVVHDSEGVSWVFFGWSSSTRSSIARFVREAGGRPLGPGSLWTTEVVHVSTLLRRFPDAERLLRRPDPGAAG